MEDYGDYEDYGETIASLTPWPLPDPTEAPTPVPSSKVPNDEDKEEEVEKNKDTGDTEEEAEEPEYDGPAKTGKTLKDLALDLGAPESLGSLLDDMQEAIVGIAGDLVNNDGSRTGIADILGHQNRLRGIGALLVLVALVGIALDMTVGESLRPPASD